MQTREFNYLDITQNPNPIAEAWDDGFYVIVITDLPFKQVEADLILAGIKYHEVRNVFDSQESH